MIQSCNGKDNKKIRQLSEIQTESRDTASSSGSAPGLSPPNEVVGMTLTPELQARLEQSLLSVPDVDSRRVDEIKTALKSGSLRIAANDIAAAMIRLDRSLGD